MAARTINVSNAVQLAAAIRSAKGGETILLASGDYGAISIKGRMLADTVTIKSADANNDARITDLRIDRSSGFRFEDIDLNRPLKAGEADFTQAAYISKSSNIQLVGIDFRGSMDGNARNDGVALRITEGSSIAVTGSTFEQWTNAGQFTGIKGLTISGNTVTNTVHSFGLTGLSGAVVEGNSFIGVKADWSAGVAGVTFRGNTVTGVDVPAASGKGVVIAVADAGQLAAAIARVVGGETILLSSGDYGALTIKGRAMAGVVTIKSADSAADAVFSGIRVYKSSGFVFSDIDVHRPLAAGEAAYTQAVYISGSSRIDLLGVAFSGSLDNNPWNDGQALRVADSQDIRLVDSTFEQWTLAASFAQVERLVVAGNSVTDVREGFDFAAVHHVTIAQNRLFGFDPNYAAGDHSDAIQFWNAGVNEGSSHVVIRDNIILQGANGGTQGIFIGAEVATARHSDFLIENNLYNGDARHGITLNGIDGAVVRGNTVTSAAGGYLEAGININKTTGVLVEHNITPLLLQNYWNTELVIRDNIDLWDSKSKVGQSLAHVFEAPSGGLFSEGNFVARGAAGFHGFDGIGSASFDVQTLSSTTSLGSLLQTLMIA